MRSNLGLNKLRELLTEFESMNGVEIPTVVLKETRESAYDEGKELQRMLMGPDGEPTWVFSPWAFRTPEVASSGGSAEIKTEKVVVEVKAGE